MTLAMSASASAEEAFDWSGAYLGASIDAQRLAHSFKMPGVHFQTTDDRHKSLGGASAFAGYNWQFANRALAGVELTGTVYQELDEIGLGSFRNAVNQTSDPFLFASMEAQFLVAGSVQAKFGYSFGRIAITGSAGPSVASVKYWGVGGASNKSDFSGPYHIATVRESDSKILVGLTAGIAAEVAVTQNIVARVKLEHTEWGKLASFPAKRCASCAMEEIEASVSTNQVSVGLAYRF